MAQPPPAKRQRKNKKMGGGAIRADDPIYMARAVTIERVATIDRSGRQRTKEIKVPLVLPDETAGSTSTLVHEQEDTTAHRDFEGGSYEDPYDEGPVRPPATRMVCDNIIYLPATVENSIKFT
jgi:hypothetical protein